MKLTKNKIIITVILAVGLTSILFVSLNNKDDKADKAASSGAGKKSKPAPEVEVMQVKKEDITRKLSLTGEVIATDSVVIAATKEGPVTYCPWREGDKVEEGEKLLEIDREVHRAELKTAEAALEVAKTKLADLKAGTREEEIEKARATVNKWRASVNEARHDFLRQQELAGKDFTSREKLEQARERLKVSEAELRSAEQHLQMLESGPTKTELAKQEAEVKEADSKLTLAQAHLAECVINAPFSGIITAVHVRPGDLVTPRNPLLEMYDPESLVIRFSVPERHSAKVQPGLLVEAQLDAMPEREFLTKVSRVYPRLGSDTRMRTIEAKLDTETEIIPYQFARLQLQLESVEDAITIPVEAINETPTGKKTVFVIKDKTAIQREVQTAIEQAGKVQITEGIEAGEKVVVTGSDGLKDGGRVRSSEF